MINILAVSDEVSQSIEHLVEHSSEKLKPIDLILSCGDLDKEYLELLVDGIRREVFFVYGNHIFEDDFQDLFEGKNVVDVIRTFPKKVVRYIAGQRDLHGRIEIYKNYIIAGFGGSMWYGGKGNEHTEKEMLKVVNKLIRKIKLFRVKEKILGKPKREVIVISHAPIFEIHDEKDRCHNGFKCFMKFVKKVSPLLWIHGHVRPADAYKNQVSIIDKTTVVNVFGHKFIKIDKNKIEVAQHYNILNKNI